MGSLGASSNIVIETAPIVESYSVLYGSRSFDLIGSTGRDLPWQITGIQAVFSEPIVAGSTASLAGLAASGVTGLGTNTLTWTFPAITSGSFATSLLGSGTFALRDAAGNPLAARFRLHESIQGAVRRRKW